MDNSGAYLDDRWLEAAMRLAARRAVEIDMADYLPERVLKILEAEK